MFDKRLFFSVERTSMHQTYSLRLSRTLQVWCVNDLFSHVPVPHRVFLMCYYHLTLLLLLLNFDLSFENITASFATECIDRFVVSYFCFCRLSFCSVHRIITWKSSMLSYLFISWWWYNITTITNNKNDKTITFWIE